MALGAMTRVSAYADANKRARVYDVVLGTGANYPTGGETITPAMAGMRMRIEQVLTHGIARATAAGATSRTVSFDYLTTPGAVKMQVHTTASAEAANSSDQSAFAIRLTFIGV